MCEDYSDYPTSHKELKELRKNGSEQNRYFTGKPCSKCGVVGLRNPSGQCVECLTEYRKSEKIKKAKQEWYNKNKDHCKKRCKEYRENNKETLKEKRKAYKEKNPNYFKEYYNENYMEINERKRNYYGIEENRQKARNYGKRYRTENADKINHSRRKRYRSDLLYRLGIGMHCMVRRTFNAISTPKSDTAHNILGYSPQDLKDHLESHFLPGMTWDNYGHDGWHIDHRVSVAEHLRNGCEDPAVINALDNLYPMWAEDNFRKRDKPFEPLTVNS